MIRHDLQQDIIEAHRSLLLARELSTQIIVLDEISKAHGRVLEIADKLGIDLAKFTNTD